MRIEIKDVTKTIKGALILDRVTLSFESGKIFGPQGPNGSGKTMLMRLIRPTRGEVLIDGKRLGHDIDFPAPGPAHREPGAPAHKMEPP